MLKIIIKCVGFDMKRSIVLSVISIPLLAHWTMHWSAQVAHAQANVAQSKFYCGQSKNVPTTMAQTSRGPVSVIRWVSTLGEEYTPESRCKIVSEKFQTFYQDGTLNYLTTGVVNQQNVICAAQVENGSCVGVLFTLKPNSDPGRTLERLLSVRDRAPNAVLNEGAPRVYISLKDFLETAPVETDQSALENITPPQSQSDSPSSSDGKEIW